MPLATVVDASPSLEPLVFALAGLLDLGLGLQILVTTHRGRRKGTDALVTLVRHPGYTGAASLLVTGVLLVAGGVLEAL